MSKLTIRVETEDVFWQRARNRAREIDAGDRTEQGANFSFATVERFLEVMTVNRWRLAEALRSQGPSSIRSLAGSLGRDYKAVHSDVGALIGLGLVERRDDGRVFVPWDRIELEATLAAA
jgi:predicted transcriptional regulator